MQRAWLSPAVCRWKNRYLQNYCRLKKCVHVSLWEQHAWLEAGDRHISVHFHCYTIKYTQSPLPSLSFLLTHHLFILNTSLAVLALYDRSTINGTNLTIPSMASLLQYQSCTVTFSFTNLITLNQKCNHPPVPSPFFSLHNRLHTVTTALTFLSNTQAHLQKQRTGVTMTVHKSYASQN